MKASLALTAVLGAALLSAPALGQPAPDAQTDLAALKSEVEALKRLVPDQAHAMSDVDYHFANLWFAAKLGNWPLSEFYLNETISHLNWAVRLRPVRRLSGGQELDLRAMLQGIEQSSLGELKTAVSKKEAAAFEAAYRHMMNSCYACHTAAEKPYLRPHIPETPAARMIDLAPPSSIK